jgi:hypothetical protein
MGEKRSPGTMPNNRDCSIWGSICVEYVDMLGAQLAHHATKSGGTFRAV